MVAKLAAASACLLVDKKAVRKVAKRGCPKVGSSVALLAYFAVVWKVVTKVGPKDRLRVGL